MGEGKNNRAITDETGRRRRATVSLNVMRSSGWLIGVVGVGLAVFSCGGEEFGAADDVSLVFKTGSAGGRSLDEVRAQAADALRDAGGPRQLPANVVFHYSTLSAAEMPRLYRAADAFALPSRGEGWGRPLQEAMLMGLPTIATRWSGHLEFMNDENSWLLECQIVDVPAAGWREAAIYQGHRWAEPDRLHLRRVLREVFENREAARSRGAVARHHILSRYSRAAVARLVHGATFRLDNPTRGRLHGRRSRSFRDVAGLSRFPRFAFRRCCFLKAASFGKNCRCA